MSASAATTDAGALPAHVPVVVVGAGPVGSATALELRLRDVPVLVVERDAAIPQPHLRARNIASPTMERARRWGIASELRAAPRLPQEWHRGWLTKTAVGGRALLPPIGDGLPLWAPAAPWRELSTEAPLDLPQYRFHALVRSRAADLGAQFVFGWEVVDLAQDSGGVTLGLRRAADGSDRRVRADWVVAADGGRSEIRDRLGITLASSQPLGRQLNATFRLTDAFARLGIDPGVQFRIVQRGLAALVHPYEPDRWRVATNPVPLTREIDERFVRDLIRRAFGADLPIEELAWTTHLVGRRVADRYRSGRVLLAGNAGATFPPQLGQNLNVGIADAVAAGWTLWALVGGWGGPALLDAYDHERRVASDLVASSTLGVVGRWQQVAGLIDALPADLDDDAPAGVAARTEAARLIEPLLRGGGDGVIFDQRVPRSPIVTPEPTAATPPWEPGRANPAALAGHRLPHVWLTPTVALSDQLGGGFSLLVRGLQPAAVADFTTAARAARIPLTVVQLPTPAAVALDRDLVLVRPDGVIAWSGAADQVDPRTLLARSVGAGAEPAPTLADDDRQAAVATSA